MNAHEIARRGMIIEGRLNQVKTEPESIDVRKQWDALLDSFGALKKTV